MHTWVKIIVAKYYFFRYTIYDGQKGENMNKVVIIGCGNVGMSYAFALVAQPNRVDQLVLIDVNQDKAIGEAMDLNHALPYSSHHITIKAGSYADCDDATMIVICAGRNQEIGETRLDLITKNYQVFQQIITEIHKTKFSGIYLVATNPLDVMTYITYKLSKSPANKVIGSGTTLDTARLRCLLGEKLQVNPKNVHAYVLGEHGDSEFIPWDQVMIGSKAIKDFHVSNETKKLIEQEVRHSAYDIIAKKGNTSYGIGMCLVAITNAILEDSKTIFTVSTYDKENDCYFGKPSVLGKDGIEETYFIPLSPEDEKKLARSIRVIQEVIHQL